MEHSKYLSVMGKTVQRKEAGNYWQGRGRRLIVIPEEVIKRWITGNTLYNQLYITDMGFYPAAKTHYTFREKGCAEMIIIFCVNGKGSYEVPTGTYQVLPGQFFMLPPGQQHTYKANDEEPWSIYWIRISGHNIAKFCAQPAAEKCFKPMYIKNVSTAVDVFEDIYTTLENGYSLQHLAYSNMTLQHLLATLLYRVQETKKVMTGMTENAIDFMKANIGNQYSLLQLASAFNYSPSRFSGIFREETGYSPIDYFIHLKLQESCRLLDFTEMKIYEIALQVGYQDPYHFSRLFKKIMHLSPEKYRQAKKG